VSVAGGVETGETAAAVIAVGATGVSLVVNAAVPTRHATVMRHVIAVPGKMAAAALKCSGRSVLSGFLSVCVFCRSRRL
jgi:hypothetical protein